MTTIDPPIKAILPYLGGKRRMAPRIVDIMLEAGVKQYVEPYHGSLAVLLELRRRGFEGSALVNDADSLLYNLVKVIQDDSLCEWLRLSLDLAPFHEFAYQCACMEADQWRTVHYQEDLLSDRMPEYDRVAVARAYLMSAWMGPNGFAGSEIFAEDLWNRFCNRWTTSGGDPPTRWNSVIKSLPFWHQLMRTKTTYLCRDALKVLAKVDDQPGLCIYADPPYLRATRGKTRYMVDVEDNTGELREGSDHHAQLAARLNAIKNGTVIVSYYAHERLERLYPPDRWEHIDCAQNKATAQAKRGAAKKSSPEVLIVRRSSS